MALAQPPQGLPHSHPSSLPPKIIQTGPMSILSLNEWFKVWLKYCVQDYIVVIVLSTWLLCRLASDFGELPSSLLSRNCRETCQECSFWRFSKSWFWRWLGSQFWSSSWSDLPCVKKNWQNIIMYVVHHHQQYHPADHDHHNHHSPHHHVHLFSKVDIITAAAPLPSCSSTSTVSRLTLAMLDTDDDWHM